MKPNFPSRYDGSNYQDKVQYDMTVLRADGSGIIFIDRAGTSSTNTLPFDSSKSNMKRSLLIENVYSNGHRSSPYSANMFSNNNQDGYTDIQRRVSLKKREQAKRVCHQWVSRFARFVKKKMAFKPDVTEDPHLYSSRKKRLILACLALGASLNGFCSTVYVKLFAYMYRKYY
jgi:hypothetical protein